MQPETDKPRKAEARPALAVLPSTYNTCVFPRPGLEADHPMHVPWSQSSLRRTLPCTKYYSVSKYSSFFLRHGMYMVHPPVIGIGYSVPCYLVFPPSPILLHSTNNTLLLLAQYLIQTH